MNITMNDIISFIITTKENTDDFDWMDYPITVAYKEGNITCLSDISSICFNGKSIQLNEEMFARDLQ